MELKQFNPMKILYHFERVADFLMGKNIYPVTVEIDPSNACNHDCIWCTFELYRSKSKDMMPREILMQLVQDLADNGVKAIIWTGGGEPLLNPATMDAVKLAAKLGLDMGMATNGALLDKHKCETLVDTHTYVRISLDAAKARTHKSTHRPTSGRNDFKKIVENMRMLARMKKEKGSNVSLGASLLVHPKNYKEIYDAAKLVKEIGFDFFQIKPVVMYRGKQLPKKVFKQAESLAKKAQQLSDDKFTVHYITYKFKDITDEKGDYGRTYKECLGHPFMCSVGADCNVYLCCHLRGMPMFSFGSLKEQRFKEIWEGKQRQEAIKRIDFRLCQPLCKAHEYNKLLDYMRNPKHHKNIL